MRLFALLAAGLFAGGLIAADDKKDEKKPKDEEAILGTWKFDMKQDQKKSGPRIVIVRPDSSASYGTQTVRWRIVGDSLALALGDSPHEHVLVLDGDGSLLMNLGSLATMGYHRPEKLILGILDNATYASTAGFATYAERLDLGAIAGACGLEVTVAATEDRLRSALNSARRRRGPQVIHIRIEPGNAGNIPLLLPDPAGLAARFRTWLVSASPAGT